MLHVLDDFLLLDHPNSKPDWRISALKDTFAKLGIPQSEEKTSGPLQAIEFLGIALDSNLMRASLTLERLKCIWEAMRKAQEAVVIPKRELLSLLGLLDFAMHVILL